jgi:hypothetical protein
MSDQSNNKGIVEGFLKKAGQYGMPTMVLTAALSKARYESVADKAKQGTTDNGRLIKLQAGEYRVLASVDPFARVAQSDAIGSLYHESTHSCMWKIQSADVTQAYQAAADYYKHEPLADGSRLNSAADLDYFLDEVAAEYTEYRIQSWWTAFAAIELAVSTLGKKGAETVLSRILYARGIYERDSRAIPTASDQFGYVWRGLIFKNDVRSTLPISPDFAKWLDGTTLEGKIERHFDQDRTFKKLIRDAGLPPLLPYEPPPSVPVDTNPPRIPRWQTIPKITSPKKRLQHPGILKQQTIQDGWPRVNQLRQQQLRDDQLRRNQEMLQHQRDLRHRMQERQREDFRRQQEQQRRQRELTHRTHNPTSRPHHPQAPTQNPFGGTHNTGGIKHGGSHGVFQYGPVHHATNLHIHHPAHRSVHTPPINPFGVGGNSIHGTWKVAVQNNAGAWSRGPLNRF